MRRRPLRHTHTHTRHGERTSSLPVTFIVNAWLVCNVSLITLKQHELHNATMVISSQLLKPDSSLLNQPLFTIFRDVDVTFLTELNVKVEELRYVFVPTFIPHTVNVCELYTHPSWNHVGQIDVIGECTFKKWFMLVLFMYLSFPLSQHIIIPRHEVEGGYRFRCRPSVRPSFRHSVIPSVCPEIVSGA